jgi:dienelactone hydrolase
MRRNFVAFATRTEPPLTIAGELRLPETDRQCPAVLVCHGSDGVDVRGAFHIDALVAAGFATFEIDMWAARGTMRGATARPRSVPSTLPDAYAALDFLAAQPEIDPARIAIIGFSWGGVVAMLAATRRYTDDLAAPGQAFAAHAAFYPVLWSYNKAPGHDFADLTGAPVLIQAGADDAYDDPDVCEAFLDRLDPTTRAQVDLKVWPGATHAFDRDLPAKTIVDPYAHNGAGGPVRFEFNRTAAEGARAAMVGFLTRASGGQA